MIELLDSAEVALVSAGIGTFYLLASNQLPSPDHPPPPR